METTFPEGLLYEGVSVDIAFAVPRPAYGDLFRICGQSHPRFPPTGEFGFERLADLQFEQVDDYFGVRALSNEGSDVPVWLYPLISGEPVHHHPGPFDAIRLEYNVLRNPVSRAQHFLHCVQEFGALGTRTEYRNRRTPVGSPPDLSLLRTDIEAVVQHWADQGITVGSTEALAVDF